MPLREGVGKEKSSCIFQGHKKNNPERRNHQNAQHNGGFADRRYSHNVKQGPNPYNSKTNRYFNRPDLRKEKRCIFNKKNRINCKVHEGIKPRPPAFIKTKSKAERSFHPLIITSFNGHHALSSITVKIAGTSQIKGVIIRRSKAPCAPAYPIKVPVRKVRRKP